MLLPLPAVSVTYDDSGNQTSDGEFLYEWDFQNRLRRVRRTAGGVLIAEYDYDAAGRRVRKEAANSGKLDGTTDFYLDGWQEIEEYQLKGQNEKLARGYIFGIGIDEPLAMSVKGEKLFYHQNTLGSVFALTNAGGDLVELYQYDAYGRQTVFDSFGQPIPGGVSAFGNPFLFTGRRLDSETLLIYNRARYLDVVQGRFLARDLYTDFDLYAYVQNNPTNSTDPTGLQAKRAFDEKILNLPFDRARDELGKILMKKPIPHLQQEDIAILLRFRIKEIELKKLASPGVIGMALLAGVRNPLEQALNLQLANLIIDNAKLPVAYRLLTAALVQRKEEFSKLPNPPVVVIGNVNLFAIPGKIAQNVVHKLIKDLGSEDFNVRERATKELMEVGSWAPELLRKATKSNDAEVSRRAQRILGQLAEDFAASSFRGVVKFIPEEDLKKLRSIMQGEIPSALHPALK
ncbi:MAG: hypothetical protein KatS3mg105_2862 [Gemmatales bacterium]|nr:MAG: hypothetical protein KatS3mg105_2862 [Gemmatales bacterium]